MYINRGTVAEINLDAIANNVRFAKKNLKPGVKLCAVVKANGYGHGAVRVALESLKAGAEFLAVAIAAEGVELREAGIDAPILVLGPMMPQVADIVVKYDLAHAVFDEERLYALNEAALRQNKKAKIHIKIDTGMRRIGVQPKEAGKFAKLAASLPGIEIEGTFSHFSTADGESKDYSALQFANFMEAISLIEAEGIRIPIRHIANSAAITELPQYQLDMVRQGISLYGLLPGRPLECYNELRQAMCVKSVVAHIKTLPAGESVGYGRTFTTPRECIIATVPLGYADGVDRHLSNRGHMLVHGQKAPIAGRVCMDQLMLDVTDIPDVKVGDEVIVLGHPDVSTELVAEWAETITHEITCGISPRVPREYVRD